MKILIVVDKQGTAIDRLAQAVREHNPHHDIRILPVHPKRNDADTLYEASKLLIWCDVIDVHYWKSGEILRVNFAKQWEEKPKILFHFNPYDAENDVNKAYDLVVVGNKEIHNRVPYAYYIPYGVDLSFFKFKEDYEREKIVQMSVNRIEGKKGVLEVAKACKELGYQFHLIGRVSNGEYMQSVLDVGGVRFWENASDEQLRDSYYKAAIHVCNSIDGYESGTLPILEAMACGTPVLTRPVGHVPELFNGNNMVVRTGSPEDVDDIKKNLQEMMEGKEWRLKMRELAWDTVRTRDIRRMARAVSKLYLQVYKKGMKSASVIIPTKDNPQAFIESLVGALNQDYPKYEVIIADSGETPVRMLVEEAKRQTDIPITYLHFPHKNNYTLAEARNRAVVEAEGDIVVFCDDRLRMDKTAVGEFVANLATGMWVWGVKDGVVKGFVENFSAVHRKDLIDGGMFCERMQWYGGMTQEIRQRFELGRKFEFVLVNAAKAKQVKRSKGKATKRDAIVEAKFMLYKMYGE